MAQIQSVNTQIEIQQPQRMVGRPVTNYATPIAEGLGVLVEAFRPKLDEDQVARNLLAEANQDLDSLKGALVNQQMRPSEFRDQAQANFLSKMSANKNISPKMWGAISAQFNQRLDTLSKEHWFQSDGKQMLVDAAGNVQVAYDPTRAQVDQDVEALFQQFPKQAQSIINMIERSTDNPEYRRAQIQYFTDLGVRKTRSDFETQIRANEYQTRNIVKSEDQEVRQQELMTTIGSELQAAMSTFLPRAVANPEEAYADFLVAAQSMKWMLVNDAASAGFTLGQVESMIDSQVGFMKGMFDARSKHSADSYELKALEMEQQLRLARMKGQLGDAELFAVEEPNAMMSLVMNSVYGNMLSNNASFAIGVTRTSQKRNADLDKFVTGNQYMPILERTEQYFEDFMDGGMPDLYNLQQYFEALKAAPEAVGEENQERVTILLKTFDVLMKNDPDFRWAMTIGKKQLPKETN